MPFREPAKKVEVLERRSISETRGISEMEGDTHPGGEPKDPVKVVSAEPYLG